MAVYRIYSEKKSGFDTEAVGVFNDIKTNLLIKGLKSVRLINRYDVEDIEKSDFDLAKNIVFSEPQVDVTYTELPQTNGRIFAVEFLPGQFDQRADSCAQCIQLLTRKDKPLVKNARVYILDGEITDPQFDKIKNYLINPVESHQASLEAYATIKDKYNIPTEVKTVTGFITADNEQLKSIAGEYSLAMDFDDVLFCRAYFKDTEKRDPTVTELKMIDTYWSDHCRHTTFGTEIQNIQIDDETVKAAFEQYLAARNEVYINETKPMTLMDIATIGTKILKKQNLIKNLDESEEINACSIKVKAKVNGKYEDYILMFKNETHNHPTEIEPFGGAATCLGGAIRDPLSGRSYVYQAMRVTGAGDPRMPVENTTSGKLPQKKICQTAAAGYSSYGNQIGLATGYVNEIYHEGYVAKRLEIGAVLGAAPAENIVREIPSSGDVIILLGGRTGRDGCGGATGSSRSHTLDSITECGSEVQKGNPPEERKIQRLFRNKNVTKLIKRCNDFGAGGISVAIGELADGLSINLNAVPKKYEGLDGTELAISESQERMACVVAKENADKFIEYAKNENLEATIVAEVTDKNRLEMYWNNKKIVDLSREFLNSNGASKYTDIKVNKTDLSGVPSFFVYKESYCNNFKAMLYDLNICSQKGLIERFDGSIGASSVTMPFGGINQLTPVQYMAAKLPVLDGETDTTSVMAYGFNPYLSEKSPYHGAVAAIIESISRIVAAGCDYKNAYLTLQEYFERTKGDPSRWGKPFAALLGALKSQLELGIAAIGGKDSMSGTFEDIDVPPTLVSFAVSTTDAGKVITPEFKQKGSNVYLIKPDYDKDGLPCFNSLKSIYNSINKLSEQGKILSSWAVSYGGVAEGILKMSFGNKIGFNINTNEDLFKSYYGSFIIETKEKLDYQLIGTTTDNNKIMINDEQINIDELISVWLSPLESVYPLNAKVDLPKPQKFNSDLRNTKSPLIKIAKPKVIITTFPGTNCEYDTARAFEKAGGDCKVFILCNQDSSALENSIKELETYIKQSNIVMLPGGFSGGDEPDGSGKFINAVFRNPRIKDAVHDLIKNRDGLMLGICNGFQALIKLGLVPFGEIVDTDENCPTLTYNSIGRHQSLLVNTRVSSTLSPWLSACNVGDIHTIAISHGEGRFVANSDIIEKLAKNGQIATQYVDLDCNTTNDIRYNPNGSIHAIEGITSPDGRIFGKMAHNERYGSENIFKNTPGNKDQKIFESGIKYFK